MNNPFAECPRCAVGQKHDADLKAALESLFRKADRAVVKSTQSLHSRFEYEDLGEALEVIRPLLEREGFRLPRARR